jgi:hypothetical protein
MKCDGIRHGRGPPPMGLAMPLVLATPPWLARAAHQLSTVPPASVSGRLASGGQGQSTSRTAGVRLPLCTAAP